MRWHQIYLLIYPVFFVRNPVFAMILAALGSITLAIPCAATFLLWCLSFCGLYWQVLAEEEYLLKQHGLKYEQYKARADRASCHSFRDLIEEKMSDPKP